MVCYRRSRTGPPSPPPRNLHITVFSRFGNARGHVKYSVSALAASKRCGLAENFVKQCSQTEGNRCSRGQNLVVYETSRSYCLCIFEGGAFWGPLGLPWVVSAASWDPPGALRGPSGRLLARGGAKKLKKCCTVTLFAKNAPKTLVWLGNCPQNCSQTDEFQDRRR